MTDIEYLKEKVKLLEERLTFVHGLVKEQNNLAIRQVKLIKDILASNERLFPTNKYKTA